MPVGKKEQQMWVVLKARDATKAAFRSMRKTGKESIEALKKGFQALKVAVLGFSTAVLVAGVMATKKMIGMTKNLIKSSIDTAAEFEKLRIQFGVMVGDVAKGEEIFEELWRTAQKIPFTIDEIARSAKIFQAWGVMAEDVNSSMLAIADASALTGANMELMATVIGRAAQTGVLLSKGPGALLKGLLKSKLAVEDLSKVSLPEFRKGLEAILTDPKFGLAGMASKLATTFIGIKSMIKDAVKAIELEISKAGVFDAVKKFAEDIRMFLKSSLVLDRVKLIGKRVGELVENVRKKFRELVSSGKISEWIDDWIKNIDKWADTVEGFLESLPQMGTALMNMVTSFSMAAKNLVIILNDVIKTIGKFAIVPIRLELSGLRKDFKATVNLVKQVESDITEAYRKGETQRIEGFKHILDATKWWLRAGLNLTEDQQRRIAKIEEAFRGGRAKDMRAAVQDEKRLAEEVVTQLKRQRDEIVKQRNDLKAREDLYENGLELTEFQVDAEGAYTKAIENTNNALTDLNTAVTERGRALKDFIKIPRTLTQEWEDHLKAIEAANKKIADVTKATAQAMASNLENSFFDIIVGDFENLEQVMKDFAISFLRDMARIVSQQLAMKAAMGLTGFMTNAPTVAGAGVPGGGGGSAFAVPLGDRRMFASGGIVHAAGGFPRGTDTIPAMLTEGEMVLNQKQQKNLMTMLNQGGGGGGGGMVNVNIRAMDSKDVFKTLNDNKDALGAVFQKMKMNGNRGVN